MYHIVPDGFSFSFRSKWNESVYLWFLGLLSHISYVYVSISQKQTKNWGTCKQYPSYCFFSGWIKQTEIFNFFLFFFFHHVHIPFIYFEIVVDSGLRVHSMFASEYTMIVDKDTKNAKRMKEKWFRLKDTIFGWKCHQVLFINLYVKWKSSQNDNFQQRPALLWLLPFLLFDCWLSYWWRWWWCYCCSFHSFSLPFHSIQ